MKSKMIWKIFLLLTFVAGLTAGDSRVASAGLMLTNLASGSNWRTTTDRSLGNQWAIGNFDPTDGDAAFAPYENPVTQADDLPPGGQMMWNCGTGGADCNLDAYNRATGVDGDAPNEAFFGFGFDIKPNSTITFAQANIIADDFFQLSVNGTLVAQEWLVDNQVGGQPVPVTIDLTSFLQTGSNVLAIRAIDGFKPNSNNPTNNLYEYVYVSGLVASVPEPFTLSILMIGLAGLAVMSRRRTVA